MVAIQVSRKVHQLQFTKIPLISSNSKSQIKCSGNFSKLHAKAFSIRAVGYLLKWCPLEDELLSNATWLDFEHRLQKNFDSVELFVLKYKQIFSDKRIDKLNTTYLTVYRAIWVSLLTTQNFIAPSAHLKIPPFCKKTLMPLCNGVTHGYPSLTFLNVTTAQLDIHQTQSIISHPKMKQI